MRDKRFVAEHRGGLLEKGRHRLLMRWAIACAERVLHLSADERLHHALRVAGAWAEGSVPTGDAMKASVGAHAAARESSDPASVAAARSAGHAVATAHMADHSLGAALYALKAVHLSGGSVDSEREWQQERLPAEIRELALSGLAEKEKSFRI